MQTIERVLLVRHGQTDWNVNGRWQGIEPVALNDEGWAQARLLADYLRDRPISRIYSSDLPRALETATTIGQAVNVSRRWIYAGGNLTWVFSRVIRAK